MTRQLDAWGGEVRMPSWMRRVLRRPPAVQDTPERRAERHRRLPPETTVGGNADKAAVGALTDLYHEGRRKRS